MRRLLAHFILMAAVAMSVLVAPSGATAAPASCANIKDFKIAQTMLNKGHSHLDSDRDGIACESWIVKTPVKGEPSSKQGKALYRWTYWMTYDFPAARYNRWNNLLSAYYDVYAAPVAKYGLQSNMTSAHKAIVTSSRSNNVKGFTCLRNDALNYVKKAANDGDLHKDMQKLFGNAQKAAKGAPGVASIVKAYMKLGGKLATSAAGVMHKKNTATRLSGSARMCSI